MASGAIKKVTGITGLAVVPNAREVLCGLYAKIQAVLQQMPKDAAYRTYTRQIVQQRLQIVQAETNISAIEEKIGCGQVEELIEQAERELALAHKMEEWGPWQPLVSEPPPGQWKWP
ncbi:NADH dehydrogenase [ubiquinone] 1 alpha subcomplex subunit 5 [Geodia barretti]|uniref:NADH dehydrogenase [ubiquinone] 1 alpha subcomplex subunit 5 n=1 Tax=Geodia barretti TaxID=519541 RepID=A0AA35R9Z5_GEOBA|nr:NADH dehydrogenase [ubiquinone] 1 alpha subcomplex subunit 5 [Geodia barretti]